MTDAITPVLALLVNLKAADRIEVQSRPIADGPWVMETTFTPASCGSGVQARTALLKMPILDVNRIFRARTCLAADCEDWFELPQLEVICLPSGTVDATADICTADPDLEGTAREGECLRDAAGRIVRNILQLRPHRTVPTSGVCP